MITYLSLASQANIHSPEKPGKDFISFCLNPSGYDVDPDIRQHLEELHGVARRTSARYQSYITMCKGTGCVSSGEIRLKKRFDEVLKDRGLTERVRLIETGCRGFCEKGPIVSITPGEAFYCEVQEADIEELVDSHIIGGSVVERLLFATGVIKENDIAFYRKQERRVLANAGVIDPDNIDEAIASETYLGLSKALFNHSSDEVIAMVKRAGLRGRGGGGFQTGTKWELCRKSTQDPKYVICNADEGDPGAFMDRSILEADPHRLLEGMIICGYAIGSHEGHIYVRAEYPLAVKRITRAIEQAREYGLLGSNILGSGFDFDVEICQGAGAFVCGEETALISSIEGKRGIPRVKPPYPAVSGLFGKPTNVNNVETFANVPLILNKGVDWYTSLGTEGSPGTKIFALTGKVKNTGLVEVPMGITLREIIFDIGGGIIDNKEFKAAQTGGPSGGCIPVSQLDLKIDFDSLKQIGSMMGSGGLVVLDEHTCMVDLAKFFLQFTKGESCGKCIPCREGTTRMLEILESITAGKIDDPEELERLKTLSGVIIKTSACGLGMSAPNPVLSTLQYFEDEYLNHIIDKKCPAGTCKNFISYVVLTTCKGCGACKRVCPAECISGERKEIHSIDQQKCMKCGACFEKCKFDAIGVQ